MKPIGSVLPTTPSLPLDEPQARGRDIAPRERPKPPALATDAAVDVIAGVRVPKTSRWLDAALRDAENPHPDFGRNRDLTTDAVRDEARRQLAYVRDALDTKPNERQWGIWLLPLVAELRGSPDTPQKNLAAAETFAKYLDDVPLALLTLAAQKRAITTMRFWPTVNDLAAFFAADLARLRSRARHLAAVVRSQASTPAGVPPIEREAVRQGMAALAAEMRAANALPKPSLKPIHMGGNHLNAWREKQRVQVARTSGGSPADG